MTELAVRRSALLLILAGAVLTGSTLYGAYCLFTYDHDGVVRLMLVQGAVYAGAVWLAVRWGAGLSSRRVVLFILGAAVVMRLLLLFMPPVSTDIYRYVWDGRVQASGVNPYIHVPSGAALEHLRDDAIYPAINRKEYATTIYPPMAQVIYFAATRVSETVTMMKAAMLAFEALTVWAIMQLMIARGIPLGRILIYAWHPLAIWEIAGSGHIDAAAIAFMMLAFVAADKRSPWLAGVALASGVGAKLVPVIVGPALYRLWDWRLPAGFIVTLAALYALYASAGEAIFGFYSGYADEQNLASGDGFYLFALLKQGLGVPSSALPVFLAAGAGLMAVIAARSVFRRDATPFDLKSAYLLMLAFTAVISPHHAWYLLWLVPFLCFYPSPAVLYVTLCAGLLYRLGWPPDVWRASLLYGPFFILLIIEYLRFSQTRETPHVRAAH